MSKNESQKSTRKIQARAKKHASRFVSTFRSQLAALLISALGLVTALRWNDVIKRTIDLIFPGALGTGLLYDYVSAIMVTVVVVLIILLVSKLENPKDSPNTTH